MAKSSWTVEGIRGERGFSLLEVLTATTIMTVALAALAQLFVISTQANASAKTTGYTTVLAQQKMEQLRGLTFGFDSQGLPITDMTSVTTVYPENPTLPSGKGLTPSPPRTLGTNTDGYCDFVDKFGNTLGGGTTPPTGTVYIRRWSIEPIPTNPNNTLVIQVLVTRLNDRGAADQGAVKRLPEEARMITVKTRKAH